MDSGRPSSPAKKDVPHEAALPTASSPRPNTSSSLSSVDEPASPASADGGPPAEKPNLERTQSQASQFGRGRKAVIVLSLCMALFLAALDVTIVTTALPTISRHFNASASDYTWVGSAYLLAAASSAPVWGKVSDIFGRKYIILLANLVFLIGSLIAGLSNSIGLLIGARVIQGIGGGGLVILVYVCIGDLFSMRERPKYYGIMGGIWAIASGVGPVIGGAFTEGVTWRWCFYINLPLDGISLILLFVFLKLDNPRTPLVAGLRGIDWIGVLTIVGGVVMFLFGMESGGVTHPWDSAFTLCLIIFGVVTIVLFFLNEWKLAKYPIIPLRLFRHTSNLCALGVCFIHGFVFIGGSYYLPLYFQVVLGAGPILSGVYLFAMVLTFSVVSAGTGIFIKRTGRFREPIWFGLAFMTLGYGLLIDLPDHAVWSKIIIYQIVTGIGVGPNFQSPLIALQSHLKGHDIAVGTSTFGFIRNLSTSISVVLGGVVFQNQLANKQSALAQVLPPQVAAELASSSFGSATSALGGLDDTQRQALNRAYTDSLQTLWIFYTAVSAVGILIGLGIKKKELSRDKVDVKTGLAEQERVRLEEATEAQERRDRKAAHKKGSASWGRDVESGAAASGTGNAGEGPQQHSAALSNGQAGLKEGGERI
ncbi:uncharacterized protein HMPREF1541_08311 [Cyphellophora europaea CBS 101466]|uniref:Efflux pump dotC n=1 Tax=Cyphellophora europaea (strain CBS 101466) TaxID=1220924 RepID=W2RLY4_CYPE1|nr:uncharacterized protein HMPREF1541_08311 [Cyphellophora europaea CBS 101466]ETN37320.1 hypothetical protein HMPREF1541_08311 [Cyphellophora europaea CBS 101466]